MAVDSGERRYSWQVAAAFLDRLAAPRWGDWGAPGGAVAAWLATHLVAVTVFLTVVLTSSWHDPWRQAITVGWVALASGLVARLAVHLARPTSTLAPRQRGWSRLVRSPNVRAGLFLVATQLTFVAVGPLGRSTTAAFAAAVALTLGARAAGLDWWERLARPPGFYLRAVLSRGGLATATVAAGSTALAFWLPAVLIDPLVDTGTSEFGPGGVPLSRRDQFLTFLLSAAVLTPPVLAVCEAISAVGRFQRSVEEELAEEERTTERLLQRTRIDNLLHGRGLLEVEQLLPRLRDPDDRALAIDVWVSLRKVRDDFDSADRGRLLSACVDRATALGHVCGTSVHVTAERADLDVLLAPRAGLLLQHLLNVLVGNSSKAYAPRAELDLRVSTNAVDVTYYDTGKGYDPEEAMRRSGGLAEIAALLASAGGWIRFDRCNESTVVSARVPR